MKDEVSLSDLNLVYHSEIKFDTIVLPLKMDISKIYEMDYILAFSFANQLKVDKVEQQTKEHNELDDIKIVSLEQDSLELSYKPLSYQYEIDNLIEQEKLDYCLKFINTEDRLFEDNTKTLLEHIGTNNIKTWLLDKGMDGVFYIELYKTVSYWIDMITTEYTAKVKDALLLKEKDKNGTEMNYTLSKLRTCYETLNIYYFKENEGIQTFDNLSYREQHLVNSFTTKMNYIDIAINKDAKKQMEDKRSNTPSKHKNPAGAKRRF